MHLRAQRRRAQSIASDISLARGSTPVLQHVDLTVTPVSARAGWLVQSVQEALEAHAVTLPEPPLRFRFPDLPTRTGALLLSVDDVAVAGRLTGPVSFVLSHGDRLVVTGPNGAGKSTLLDVASGLLGPSTGAVRTSGGARVGHLRQETDLPPDRRASELFAASLPEIGLHQLGLRRPRESAKRVGELSMGQQRRLDLALVLATRPHVLLLDEPTNHLSVALVDELTEALGTTPAAVVVSTHDRQLLRDVAEWPYLHLTTAATIDGQVLV